jgi:hypothetical protein
MAKTAKEAVEEVQALAKFEPTEVSQYYAQWASGRHDEEMAYAIAHSSTEVGGIAAKLYDLHVMEFASVEFAKNQRAVKDWAYTLAADFVITRRRNARIPGYRLDWGRQAARDGLCRAMWGHLHGTGLRPRAEQFGCSQRGYERIRDHVQSEAKRKLGEFESELGVAIGIDSRG